MKFRDTLGLLASLVAFAALQACNGGGRSQPPPASVTPPSALGYPAPPAFTVNTAITALTPAVSGTPTGYVVSPALPAGLTLNATSGVISGTPTAVAAAANYQVTASNPGGNTSTTVSITVKDNPPNVSYARANYTFTTSSAVNVAPTSTGGAVVTWSASAALPAGLSLDITTGAITGTPTAPSPSSHYVITATNSGGSDTFDLDVAVSDGVLLNLGNRSYNGGVDIRGDRIVISEEFAEPTGSWTLWNAQDASVIAQFSAPFCTWVCGQHQELAGSTLVTRDQTGFTVRSSVDGAVVASIASSTNDVSWWRLSPDGNYIAEGDYTGLRVWSRTGAALVNKTGGYKDAIAFLSNDELRIAKGAAGDTVIESFNLPSGTATTSPAFNGTFRAWFVDGERFISTLGAAVYIYSQDAVQLDIATPPSFNDIGGYGNFYWTKASYLRVYEVGNAAATVTTFTDAAGVLPTSNPVDLGIGSSAPVSIVDLSGTTPVEIQVAPPVSAGRLFGARDGSSWAYADDQFVVRNLPGGGNPSHVYGAGAVRGIVGAGGRAAVATADGKVRVFDVQTRALLTTIDALDPRLALTANGSTLIILSRSGTDRSVRFYSLPSGNLQATWPYTYGINGQAYPTDFTLARSADRVALDLDTFGSNQALYEVRRFDGTVAYSSTTTSFHVLSPSGTRSAVPAGYVSLSPTTTIYMGTTISGAANGYSTGWIDDDRILVNFWRRTGVTTPLGFDAAKIVDPAGNAVSDSGLPLLDEFQFVSSNSVYSGLYNKIFEVTTGSTLWSSSTPNRALFGVHGSYGYGAATDDSVVFEANGLPLIRIEPR